MLQLRHLRYFEAVAKYGAFNRAARALHVSQPPLSRQIRALETMLGGVLFNRRSPGVCLTPAGELLLERTAEIRGALDLAVRRAQLADAGLLGRVRIALGRGAVADRRVGAAIGDLRAKLPGVDFVIDELSAADQVNALRARRVDIGIGIPGDHPGSDVIATTLFAECVNGVILPQAHALATAPSLRIGNLRGERLFLLRGKERWSRLFDAVRQHGITNWEELDSVEAVFGAVAAGHGWSVAVSALQNSAPWGTVYRALEDFYVPISVVAQHRENDDRQLIANLLSMLRGGMPMKCLRTKEAVVIHGWPNLELRELEVVTTVRRVGAIGSAAQASRLSVSSVTRRLAAVERATGCRLFVSKGSVIELTPAGEAFCDMTDDVLVRVENAHADVRRRVRGIVGVCRVGILPGLVDPLCAPFRELGCRRPDIAVEIHEMLSETQLEALEQRQIDVSIGGTHRSAAEHRAIGALNLMENPLDSALLSSSNPLAGRSSITLSDLAGLPFFLVDRSVSPGFYDLVVGVLERHGLSPDSRGQATGIHSLWRLVADSTGWALAPRSVQRNPPAGTVAVPIAGLSIPWGFNVRWRLDDSSPITAAVLEVIGGFSATRNGA
jgi:DNA-binding transcriptional LysR family regulator